MRMTVNVNDDLGKVAMKVAKEQGVSVSSLYATALENHLKELKRKKAIEYMNSLIGNTYVYCTKSVNVLSELSNDWFRYRIFRGICQG
jgi:hypothetical protein